MNICILVYDISLVGGAEHVALNMAKEFSLKNNVILVSVFNRKSVDFSSGDSLSQITISQTVSSMTKNFMLYSFKLRKILLDNEVDVLIAITAGVVTMANAASIRTKVKTIYTEHSSLENKTYGKKHILRQYLGAKCSNVVVTLTERDKRNFEEIFKISSDKVVTIPNWFDYDTTKGPNYNSNSTAIVTAGRLEFVKGYDYLIEIAKQIKTRHPTWHWDIYGDGTMREDISQKIEENGLTGFVRLMGNVKNIQEVYSKYSIYVLTSRYEGFPLVLLEAQAAGLPIVSFDCPTGPSEIVEDNINGFLVQAYDVDRMVLLIDDLINSKEKREKFSNNSRNKMFCFSKEHVLMQWTTLINSLVK